MKSTTTAGVAIVALASMALINQVQALSLIIQNQEPYCFLVDAKRGSEVRVQYMVSGLNEEQVEFKVKHLFKKVCFHSPFYLLISKNNTCCILGDRGCQRWSSVRHPERERAWDHSPHSQRGSGASVLEKARPQIEEAQFQLPSHWYELKCTRWTRHSWQPEPRVEHYSRKTWLDLKKRLSTVGHGQVALWM